MGDQCEVMIPLERCREREQCCKSINGYFAAIQPCHLSLCRKTTYLRVVGAIIRYQFLNLPP